jgi:hypothetical protein
MKRSKHLILNHLHVLQIQYLYHPIYSYVGALESVMDITKIIPFASRGPPKVHFPFRSIMKLNSCKRT